jgi:hypothetical protein
MRFLNSFLFLCHFRRREIFYDHIFMLVKHLFPFPLEVRRGINDFQNGWYAYRIFDTFYAKLLIPGMIIRQRRDS